MVPHKYILCMVQLKRIPSIYFIALAWHIVLTLRNKGFHEFVLTILPPSLFNTLMDLSYAAFVSKLFISNNSLILPSCMLDNFPSAFEYSQLNRKWQSLECSVAPDVSHSPATLSSCCSIDRVSTRFLFLQCYLFNFPFQFFFQFFQFFSMFLFQFLMKISN